MAPGPDHGGQLNIGNADHTSTGRAISSSTNAANAVNILNNVVGGIRSRQFVNAELVHHGCGLNVAFASDWHKRHRLRR